MYIDGLAQDKCDMAFIEPMHLDKPNITYLVQDCRSYRGLALNDHYMIDISLMFQEFLEEYRPLTHGAHVCVLGFQSRGMLLAVKPLI